MIQETREETVYLVYKENQDKPDIVADVDVARFAVENGIDVFVQKTIVEKMPYAETNIQTQITTRFYL